MDESAPSALYGYIHVPGANGQELYAAFIQISVSDLTMTGLAPQGFSPTPLGTASVPFGSEEPSQGLVTGEWVEIPLTDIAGFVSDVPPGCEPLLFCLDGSWPCADATLGEWLSLVDGTALSGDGETEDFLSAQGHELEAGQAPPPAGRGAGRKPKQAEILADMQSQIASLVAGQQSFFQQIGQRVEVLEGGSQQLPGAGRGSGLFTPTMRPPPGLQGMSLGMGAGPGLQRLPQAPPRSAPLPQMPGIPRDTRLQPGPKEIAELQARAKAAALPTPGMQPRPAPTPRPANPNSVGVSPDVHALTQAMAQQSKALTALASRGNGHQDPLDVLAGGGSSGADGIFRMGRGPAALEALQQKFQQDPDYITQRVRRNCQQQQQGASTLELPFGSVSMKGYLIKQVPFQRAKVAVHFMFALAEISDLMAAGE